MNHSVPWTPTTSPCPPLLLSCPSSLSAPQNKFISPQVKELPFSFPPASGSPGVSSERPLERVRGGEAEPCRSRGLEGSTESEEAAEGKAGAAAELKSVQPSLLQQAQYISERLHLLPLLFLKTCYFISTHTYAKSLWNNAKDTVSEYQFSHAFSMMLAKFLHQSHF